jgi:tetratricopeptide (TPR) repeat protein
MCGLSSCHWHEAKEVIAVADSLDWAEHVIYDDTAALGRTIRCLDHPFGRVLMSNTLGKAYYYMGRNLEDYHQQVAEAAGCYIEADRLEIGDPIYRGRVNSCMGYICAQNNNDSLALVFYERASEDFEKSGNEWRYAHSLLDRIEFNVKLHNYIVADSLLKIAKTYSVDGSYQARYYETRGLYFYEQQQYDSALVYFERGLEYWQNEENRCFCYLKIMQAYYSSEKDIDAALHYAKLIVEISTNPNYLSNAYYCLMQDAKNKGDAELLSKYSHARTDTQKLLRDGMIKDAEALLILEDYLQNPHPWRWVWISFPIIIVLCLLLTIGIWIYRKRSCSANEQLDVLSTHIRTQEADILHQQSLLAFEKGLTEIIYKYHSPRNHWRNYSTLKKDIDPWLRDWTAKLDTLPLSEQEKIFCTISLIYTNLSDIEIANYMCYAKGSIRILKNRILKKIGISSSEFPDFLHNLSNCK